VRNPPCGTVPGTRKGKTCGCSVYACILYSPPGTDRTRNTVPGTDCEDRIGTSPPRARTEVIYVDLGYWAISWNRLISVQTYWTRHPHGGARPFHQKSTCLTQLTSGPYVVQIWSRNVRKSERTKLAKSTVWLPSPPGHCCTFRNIVGHGDA